MKVKSGISKLLVSEKNYLTLPYQGNLFFLWGKLVYYIFHKADS